MPLSTRNLSRKLGKSVKGTASIVENLKLQHAEELDIANEEHEKKIEQLEKEVDQFRAEIDSLKLSSDEHYDKLMPLPSPSKSLKFVRNTSSRKQRKAEAAAGGTNRGNNAVSIIADIKMQHRRDLARAGAIYAKKLHSMKKEVAKYEAEALKAPSAIRGSEQGCDGGTGVNARTGVAEKDKENVSQKQALRQSDKSSNLKNSGREVAQLKENTNLSKKLTATRDEAKLQHQTGDSKKARGGLNELGNLQDQYERLFLEEYTFEKDTAYEEAIALESDGVNQAVNNEEIDKMCKDLIAFMTDVRTKSLLWEL